MGNALQNITTDFPYEIGEAYGKSGIWTLCNGTRKSDNQKVTIFQFKFKDETPDKIDMAKTTFKRFKTIRHPNILTFIDGIEIENDVIYMVTENVMPLEHFLKNNFMELGYNQAISWGLYQVLNGLEFLHSKDLYHGYINAGSIFVNEGGDWKIGELAFLSQLPPPPMNTFGFPLKRFFNYLDSRYRAPEITLQKWDIIEKYGYSIDVYGLACLIYEVFQTKLERPEDLSNVSKIPKELEKMYLKMFHQKPQLRPKPSRILKCNYFKNPVITTLLVLDTITLKDRETVDNFMKSLPNILSELPKLTCKFRILPKLVDALKFGPGGSNTIIPILKIGELMNEDEYRTKFIPSILDLFGHEDKNVQLHLLKNIDKIIPYVANDIVNTKIYPNIAIHLNDPAPALREAAVKSMLHVVPKLKEEIVSNDVVKRLWASQADREPAIRTNTVIAMGKLAPHFSVNTRKVFLIPAFARSLRDPFLHSRVAVLKALMATREYYALKDCATAILPIVAPLLVDREQEVRDIAFLCLQCYVDHLKKATQSPDFIQTLDEQAQSGQQKESGYFDWAISSVSSLKEKVSNKIYGDSNEQKQKEDAKRIGTMKQGYSAPKKIGETVKPTQPTNINQVKSPHQSPNESPNQKGWEDFGSFVSAKEQKNTPEKNDWEEFDFPTSKSKSIQETKEIEEKNKQDLDDIFSSGWKNTGWETMDVLQPATKKATFKTVKPMSLKKKEKTTERPKVGKLETEWEENWDDF